MKRLLQKFKQLYTGSSLEVKASIWFFISSVLQKGISVLSTPIFTRLLTTEEYGEFTVFNSWMNILSVFATLRLYWGVYSQGLIKFEEKRDTFSKSVQGLFCTIFLIWFGLYLLTANICNSFTGLSTSEMLAMFLTIWATGVFSFWAAEQKVDRKYKELVLVTLIVSFLKPALGILAVQVSIAKVEARVWELALVELAGYGWIFVTVLKRKSSMVDMDVWRYALHFNIPLIPHYLAQTVLEASDRIMIEKMVSRDKAGIYALACSCARLMMMANTALQQTIAPWMLRKIKNKKFSELHKPIYLLLVIIAILNLLLIFLAPEAIRLFAPPEYYEAIWVVPPVALSCYFVFAYNVFSEFEFYYEKTKLIAVSTVAAAVLNIILNYLCFKVFGYVAAGYTTLFCYICYAALHYNTISIIMKKNEHAEKIYDTRVVIALSGITVLVGLAALLVYKTTIIRYSILVALLACLWWKREFIKKTISIILMRKDAA